MINLPPSKSIGARYLVATYFCKTLPIDPYFRDNDDLINLQQALLEVYSDEEPIDYGDSPIDVGASGTALRFVTSVCASSPGADYVITGTKRLMERPMSPLTALLREAGAEIESMGENGCGPYRVIGKKLSGGSFSIQGNISSQFISALMLVSPSWEKGMNLSFTTPLVSKPYIEMTARMMERFGIKVELTDNYVKIPHSEYKEPEGFEVEADWSSASFFYEAVAIGAKSLTMAKLPSPEISLQGDAVTSSLFEKLGVVSYFDREGATISQTGNSLNKIEVDFKNCPDLVLPFAVSCLCLGKEFKFTGVSNLRLKESDRLKSLRDEGAKLGFDIEISDDEIRWDGKTVETPEDPVIDPHDDHRVAMSFAICALKFGKIKIAHPEVVEKSFIDFWNQIEKIGLNCSQDKDIMTITYK